MLGGREVGSWATTKVLSNAQVRNMKVEYRIIGLSFCC